MIIVNHQSISKHRWRSMMKFQSAILKTLENSYSLHVAAKYLVRLLVFFGGSKVLWLWCPWLWPKPLSKHLNHWIDLCHRQRLCRIDGGCTSGEDASAEHVRAKQNWRYFRHSWDHRKRTGTFVTCSRKDHQQVLTHFKKLTTGNNVFIVSVII